jgi:hypothetical protein
MRLRARHIHHLEVTTDILVGYVINIALFVVVYNWMLGHDVHLWENASGGLIFMGVAYVRKYTIRRWFSNWIGKIYDERREAEIQEQAGAA